MKVSKLEAACLRNRAFVPMAIVPLLLGSTPMLALAQRNNTTEPALQDVDSQMRELGAIYKELSGKDPTLSNLLNSLNISEPKGKEQVEISTALQILFLKEEKNGELTEWVLNCYDSHKPVFMIKEMCIRILIKLRRPEGLRYALAALSENAANLEEELWISLDLASAGHGGGYKFLKEGLASSDRFKRQLANELFQMFRLYDGKVIVGYAGTINLEDLIGDVISTSSGEIRENAKKLKKTLDESKRPETRAE